MCQEIKDLFLSIVILEVHYFLYFIFNLYFIYNKNNLIPTPNTFEEVEGLLSVSIVRMGISGLMADFGTEWHSCFSD